MGPTGTMLSGGKLINKGMYGCIFSDQMYCKNNRKITLLGKDSKHASITKIILKEDGELEYSIAQIIQKIPIWRNYFSVAESICEPAKKQKENDIGKCEVLEDYALSEFRILSMRYNGIALHSYRFDMVELDLMHFCTHIIEAVAILNLLGIVHRDMHQGNIIIDAYQVPRLIDFNLSVSEHNNKGDIGPILSHKYDYNLSQESPDATLINALLHGEKASPVIQSIIYKKDVMNLIHAVLRISKEDMYDQFSTFLVKSASMREMDINKWYKTYWRVIDSWSVGVIIISLLYKFKQSSLYVTQFKSHEKILFPVLKALCEVDPSKRIDCVQALHRLEPNHFIIRKYAGEWLKKVGHFT